MPAGGEEVDHEDIQRKSLPKRVQHVWHFLGRARRQGRLELGEQGVVE